ncbi:MAG TPA: hypothetical protein VNO21_13650 [Polyangiaceae bacterium]|nr:hypothetical protein [Polyangiaceae bacterium]
MGVLREITQVSASFDDGSRIGSKVSSGIRRRTSAPLRRKRLGLKVDCGKAADLRRARPSAIAMRLGLSFIGGASGGAVSGGAMILDQLIVSSAATPLWIKAAAMAAVTGSAVVLFLLVLRLVSQRFGR